MLMTREVLSEITSVVEDTLVDFDTSIIDEVHASSECTSDSKYKLVESSIPIQIVKYSLPTPMLDDGIESETIASSIITSSKPSIPSCRLSDSHSSRMSKKGQFIF